MTEATNSLRDPKPAASARRRWWIDCIAAVAGALAVVAVHRAMHVDAPDGIRWVGGPSDATPAESVRSSYLTTGREEYKLRLYDIRDIVAEGEAFSRRVDPNFRVAAYDSALRLARVFHTFSNGEPPHHHSVASEPISGYLLIERTEAQHRELQIILAALRLRSENSAAVRLTR